MRLNVMYESGLRTIKYRANKKPPKGGFFVPEIQYLQGFSRLFTQPKSILTQSASTYWCGYNWRHIPVR